jgi:hypothetical protein
MSMRAIIRLRMGDRKGNGAEMTLGRMVRNATVLNLS